MKFYTTNFPKLFILFLIFFVATDTIVAQQKLNIFGYFSTRLEKVWDEPSVVKNEIVKESAPAEFGYPYFNLMMQQYLAQKFKIYININGSGAGELDLRNFWGEYSMNQHFNVRLGKIYKKFGLYNEMLDAVPTYYGIEAPELFDSDHLMLSRETTFMIFGGLDISEGTFNYAFSTENGEGGSYEEVIPISFDLNYSINDFTFGTSGFISGKTAKSNVDFGSGSSNNGVLPWMENDDFTVFGGYFQGIFSDFTVQAAYWTSSHNATRNREAVMTMISDANINENQRKRFMNDLSMGNVIDNINTVADYDINTWYLRLGYSIETDNGEFAPYLQMDYYENPEIIQNKKYGGDAEAGASDDGKFIKSTVGIIYRPIYQIAIKFDQSFHFYKLNGEDVNYPEIRLDIAYTFGI